MNKRIRKKYLTNEEQKLLTLYRDCESVQFFRYKDSTDKAKNFVSIVSKAKTESSGETRWFSSEEGKISATAFIKS
ncbi:hypothetical protein [Enterococcus sp. HMSC072H05]|uniref:hypothetical protein n=1 Tax=Enterococcus sp. HMSC072H05 TaxID=1715012 RepID=UPI0008A42C4A|nr:hypothetical protein [Enterococcus sp. HMSC072H05]OFL87286.1 hypothetical protein HMPREF2742_17000 [Enterococcus sp. HMSC072H05]